MGKLVTFWSPYKGRSKTTSTMCAAAAQFGMNYPELSVALSDTGTEAFSLETKLDIRTGTEEEKQDLYKRTGVTALKVNYRQKTLTSEKIRRSAILLRMKSLFLYPNTEKAGDEFSFLLLSQTLKQEFDLVFLDLESGKKEETLNYLQASDLIVIVLPQDPIAMERFFREDMAFMEEKKRCIVIGGYMDTSRYGKKYFCRNADRWRKNSFCGVIPLNRGFLDAVSEGRVLDFFYRNQRVRNKEENYEFIIETKNTAENIRKKLFSL